MHHIHTLILDLTLITIYAGIMTLVCKKLKQPIVLGYVVAGILAGPFFNFLPTVSDREDLTLWAEHRRYFSSVRPGAGVQLQKNESMSASRQ